MTSKATQVAINWFWNSLKPIKSPQKIYCYNKYFTNFLKLGILIRAISVREMLSILENAVIGPKEKTTRTDAKEYLFHFPL